ncbi:venom serine protease-like [Epargyreus clarus]|uniref:venom serine protease-like n=1 Tax=Epargyreus clarus TaxID=520877 RepID=UPI003C2E2986
MHVTLENDIAIVKIQGTILFNEYVGPVCLPFKYASTSSAGETVTLLGWGEDSLGGSKSDILKVINGSVITLSRCQSYYSGVTSSNLCTYTPEKAICQVYCIKMGKNKSILSLADSEYFQYSQGDVGGPVLYTNRNGRLFCVGIISLSVSCANSAYPGINTRVTSFLNFVLT